MTLHSHLRRQIARSGLDAERPPTDPQAWQAFVDLVGRTYAEHDESMRMLERGQAIASDEMTALYSTVERSEQRLRSLVSLSADWIWETDSDLRFTFVSQNVTEMLGIAPERLIGTSMRGRDGGGGVSWDDPEGIKRIFAAHGEFRGVGVSVQTPGGGDRYLRVSGLPMFDANGVFEGYRGIGSDLTSARRAEQELHQLAHYDKLTGLANRAMFTKRLEIVIRRAAEDGKRVGICFIDLDMFKAVNDRFGHAAGDALLKEVSARLRGALREEDLIGRMGGDEFVVLFAGEANEPGMRGAAMRMLAAIRKPINLSGALVEVSGSLGISVFPDDARTADALLRTADAAMYHAKDQGKNRVEFYNVELDGRVAREMELVTEMRRALANRELMLYYQPKADLATGAICGCEALLRWNHPQRGVLTPDKFIHVVEEFGMSVDVGRWVIHEACRQMSLWQQAGMAVGSVAVNVTAAQVVSPSLVTDVVDAVASHDIDTHCLELEMTESMLMSQPERANEVLEQLEALGFTIAIDDFGTGYSSLAYLKRLRVDVLKIDRSFVSGIDGSSDDESIVRAVVAMAHSMGLDVVAEGVETGPELGVLRRLGVDIVQGYLIGRPMPADAFAALLSRGTDVLAPVA